MSENSNLEIKSKIVLLGEAGVGKTAIVSQFVNQIFEEEYRETKVVSLHGKNVTLADKTLIKFDIWDASGLERYRAFAKFYYKDLKAAILVYDITRKGSFNELNYWIQQIKYNCDKDIIIAIVANKYELTGKDVDEEEVLQLVEDLNAIR